MKLPCTDCLTFPICKLRFSSRYKTKYIYNAPLKYPHMYSINQLTFLTKEAIYDLVKESSCPKIFQYIRNTDIGHIYDWMQIMGI